MVSYAMYKGSSPLPAIQDYALPGYPGMRSLLDKWGCSSNGRASALQAEGCRFEFFVPLRSALNEGPPDLQRPVGSISPKYVDWKNKKRRMVR